MIARIGRSVRRHRCQARNSAALKLQSDTLRALQSHCRLRIQARTRSARQALRARFSESLARSLKLSRHDNPRGSPTFLVDGAFLPARSRCRLESSSTRPSVCAPCHDDNGVFRMPEPDSGEARSVLHGIRSVRPPHLPVAIPLTANVLLSPLTACRRAAVAHAWF